MSTFRALAFTVTLLALAAIAPLARAQTDMGGATVCAVGEGRNRHVVPCPTSNPAPATPAAPVVDNSGAEKAEKDRLAREAEKKRLADEAEKKKKAQEAFEKARDDAADTLKGSGGASGLRDTGTGNDGLRGSRDTGLREGVSSAPVSTPVSDDGVTLPFKQAILDAFPKSSSEVTERIRKGFQAIDKPDHQDWKVARAWFQDALNREPTNVGIKRLVALCDYSMAKPTPPPAKPAEPSKTMTDAERQAWYDDFQARQDKILAEQFQHALNEFYLNDVRKHPELKMEVIVKPASPAGKKPEMTLEMLRQQLQDFLGIPRPRRPTAVIAVRG